MSSFIKTKPYGPSHPIRLLGMCLGLIVWISCFVLLYIALSLGCILSPEPVYRNNLGWLNLLLVLIWFVHLAVLLWLLRRGWRQLQAPCPKTEPGTEKMLRRITLLLHALGLFGTAWIGFPIIIFPSCI